VAQDVIKAICTLIGVGTSALQAFLMHYAKAVGQLILLYVATGRMSHPRAGEEATAEVFDIL